MKIVQQNETVEFKNAASCTVWEYPHEDADINIAVVKVTGRFPESGRMVNEKSKEMAFVMEGSGKVVVEGEEIMLAKGDAILIQPGERIYWEGDLTMLMPCTPAWTKGQHKMVG